MTGMIANLMLNILIVVLLAVTIAYCWILNRRIRILQDSKSELAQLLKHFDESTQRASESIVTLQTASKKIGENIKFRIEKANFLLDDMAFMIERGNKLTNQLEANFAVNRARARVMAEQPESGEEAPDAAPVPVIEKPAARMIDKPVSSREKMAASLEAVLERVVGRNKAILGEDSEEDRPARERREPTRARSKAEQELLDMIKAGVKG